MMKRTFDRSNTLPHAGCVAAVVMLTAGFWVNSAQAMSNFPATIQSTMNLNYTPQCTLCHATTSGGGAVVTKFGQAMVAAGLTTNVNTVSPALAKLQADNTDSNGDGIADMQALADGTDPNAGVTVEKYGCGARIANGKVQHNATATLAMVLMGLMLLHRRRRT